MEQQTPAIFLSYASPDMEIREALMRHLVGIFGNSLALSFGEEKMWLSDPKGQMDQIGRAEIVMVLVSRNYLKTPSLVKEALPFILSGKQRQVQVLPIMVDENDWTKREFSDEPAFPYKRPIESFDNQHLAYEQIGRALMAIIDVLRNEKAHFVLEQEIKMQTRQLDLSGMGLSNIPVDLLLMPWLKSVNLASNLIGKIAFLDELVQLEVLHLEGNQIAVLENFDQLVKLKELHVSFNKIEVIDGIASLEALEVLDIQGNTLSDIRQIGQNKALKTLGLSNNQLTSLEGIQPLKKLEILYAAHNQLKDLEPLKDLHSLSRIILTNNQFNSVKPLLYHIKTGGLKIVDEYSFKEDEPGIFIKDNTALNEPSIEVIQSGRSAVLKYFADVDQYGWRKLELLKLVLVGNSRVGKTNLSQFLRKKKVNLDSSSTHLLDIQGWDAPFLVTDDKTLMHVKIFDFGGQDYYHDSHRMYYSHDTAYLLLWDTASNKYSEEKDVNPASNEEILYENFPLEYWLESINYNVEGKFLPAYKNDEGKIVERRSGKSVPVLIIQNKIDLGEGKLDQKSLADKYKNIWGFYNLSLATKKRTSLLYEVLDDYLYALELSGRRLVKFEMDVVNHFLASKKSLRIISLDQFMQECISIVNDDSINFNKDNATIIAQILNNTGVILFEKTGENEGLIYSNIQELNLRVKDVMSAARDGNDKGIFSRSQVKKVKYRDAVIELLLRNNSIIKINDNEFLAPQFLPTLPDPSIQFFLHSFSFTQMRFVYRAYFHKTLLLSLFAKYLQGRHIDTSTGVKSFPFWRNGIIVKKGDETGGKREMVLVEFEKNAGMGIVNIRTMRPFSKLGLEREIEQTLDELNKGWTVEKQVSADGIRFFNIDYLKSESESKQFSFTHTPDLFNTDRSYWVPNNPTSPTPVPIIKKNFSVNEFKEMVDFTTLPKKLFISYSSKNSNFVRRFMTHLEVLKANGLIDPWYDRMIEAGTKWDDSIRTEMTRSDVIVFLLSPDFLATEYIMKEEVPMAIELFKANRKFFFVQLLPCSWAKTVLFPYQQSLSVDDANKIVISINSFDNDLGWTQVINQLETKLSKV